MIILPDENTCHLKTTLTLCLLIKKKKEKFEKAEQENYKDISNLFWLLLFHFLATVSSFVMLKDELLS